VSGCFGDGDCLGLRTLRNTLQVGPDPCLLAGRAPDAVAALPDTAGKALPRAVLRTTVGDFNAWLP